MLPVKTQAVMLSLKSGIWSKPTHNVSTSELSRLEKVKDELTCSDTIVLKANRIVVPSCLQERIIDLAHEGHQGLVKTKILLREKVWFPCMDNLVESKIKSCLACQVANPVTKREPLQMTVLPDNPFDEVSIDFVYVKGENLLLLIDDYSRFPLVEPVILHPQVLSYQNLIKSSPYLEPRMLSNLITDLRSMVKTPLSLPKS